MPKKKPTEGELALLAKIRQNLPQKRFSTLRLGIGDDCAILSPRSVDEVIVTTDLSLENVHFRRDWHSPEAIGHRCLARGLSDIASMGGRPMAIFLSLAVPAELTRSRQGKHSWLDRFYKGLMALAEQADVPLAGGDLAQNPTVAADIVLLGSTPKKKALLRSGAKPGDNIYVTGALGGSASELLFLSQQPKRYVKAAPSAAHPHLFPQPRLAVGQTILKKKATAAIDISDGLSTDLMHLCEESGVRARIEASQLPIHALAHEAGKRLGASAMDLALSGGEDYELLFTAPPNTRIPSEIASVPIHCIGRVERKGNKVPGITLVRNGEETPILAKGWQHFSR